MSVSQTYFCFFPFRMQVLLKWSIGNCFTFMLMLISYPLFPYFMENYPFKCSHYNKYVKFKNFSKNSLNWTMIKYLYIIWCYRCCIKEDNDLFWMCVITIFSLQATVVYQYHHLLVFSVRMVSRNWPGKCAFESTTTTLRIWNFYRILYSFVHIFYISLDIVVLLTHFMGVSFLT